MIQKCASLVLYCLGVLPFLAACGPGAMAAYGPAATPAMEMPMPSPAARTAPTGTAAPTAIITGPKVVIDNFSFGPQVITVSAGSTVTWVNQDDTAHTVSSTDKLFSSGALDTGDTFSYRFTTPGTYRYYCMIHPKMTGEVVVQ